MKYYVLYGITNPEEKSATVKEDDWKNSLKFQPYNQNSGVCGLYWVVFAKQHEKNMIFIWSNKEQPYRFVLPTPTVRSYGALQELTKCIDKHQQLRRTRKWFNCVILLYQINSTSTSHLSNYF